MNKEIVTKKTIEWYIDQLVAVYGLRPNLNETALKIQYDHHLYAECVHSMMQIMNLNFNVKLTCYADHLYPCSESAARIQLPNQFPIPGTVAHRMFRINVETKASTRDHFNRFIAAIAHELAHVVLHSTKHPLFKSEVATDLCVLVFGFHTFVSKGRLISTRIDANTVNHSRTGYLDNEQFMHAVYYIEKIRKQPKTTQARKESPVVPIPQSQPNRIAQFVHLLKKLFS